MGSPLRIFLDANVLFSAAKSDGAVRRLLYLLHADGHYLVADSYVSVEARRNVAAKVDPEASAYLDALLSRIEVIPTLPRSVEDHVLDWLPDKDRPVLRAAAAGACQLLLTGDKKHFGAGYGKVFLGVQILAPAQLSVRLWGGSQSGS